MRRIYLDHNATSPPGEAARAAVRHVESHCWGNPHSPHAEGRAARGALEGTREQVAALVARPPADVFFTSGGTEAAHTALRGMAHARLDAARRDVVMSGLEHACMVGAADALARAGFNPVVVPPDPDGTIDAGRFIGACGERTAVAALLSAHNEFGTLQPVEEVAAALAPAAIPLVVDAVQVPGRQSRVLPAGEHVVGMLSAHKFGGLAGAGAVIAAPAHRLVPLLSGGTQERGRRSGTPSLTLIAAMGAAAAEVGRQDAGAREHLQSLRDRLENRLRESIEDLEVVGAGVPRLPNTTAVLVAGVRGEDLVAALDLAGIAASTGSACSTGAARPSASLLALGCSPQRAREMVRFSAGPETLADDIDLVVDATVRAVARLRAHATVLGAGTGRLS